MLNRYTAAIFALISVSVVAAGCGGGGGGGTDTALSQGPGKTYRVRAAVASSTCSERKAAVNQLFTISDGQINTSLLSIPTTQVDGQTVGAFSETNGDCVRDYEVKLSDAGSDSVAAILTSRSTCSGAVCETVWQGTGSPEQSKDLEFEDKVRGEACNSNISSNVGYRPSLFECNGCAAVLMSGSFRSNYSVVVRRDGQYNDRDPNNPTCGTNACSPYKTQKRIELPAYQVNCLGDSGFSPDYVPVNRISIKFGGLVTNPNDANQFEQFCLANTRESLN